jgi:hypothetical protein
MIRHTRQEAKAAGLPTCYGSPCAKHPELEGLRRVSGACVECAKATLRASRATNPERTQAQKRKDRLKAMADPIEAQKKRDRDAAYRKANKAKCRATIVAWSAKNPEKVKRYASKVKKTHKGAVNASTAARRAARIQRTPKWLTEDDFWMIEQAYELAACRTKLFGFPWHVDHEIPLQGKIVSGLHTPYNLRVIPGAENVKKGARYGV